MQNLLWKSDQLIDQQMFGVSATICIHRCWQPNTQTDRQMMIKQYWHWNDVAQSGGKSSLSIVYCHRNINTLSSALDDVQWLGDQLCVLHTHVCSCSNHNTQWVNYCKKPLPSICTIKSNSQYVLRGPVYIKTSTLQCGTKISCLSLLFSPT